MRLHDKKWNFNSPVPFGSETGVSVSEAHCVVLDKLLQYFTVCLMNCTEIRYIQWCNPYILRCCYLFDLDAPCSVSAEFVLWRFPSFGHFLTRCPSESQLFWDSEKVFVLDRMLCTFVFVRRGLTALASSEFIQHSASDGQGVTWGSNECIYPV